MNSQQHLERKEEDAIATLMGGKSQTTRRFKGHGCTDIPTKQNIMKYWGNALPCLAAEAKRRHIDKGTIYVDNKDKKRIAPEDVRGYRLGIVSYKGNGKYSSINKFRWFDDLPDSEEVTDEEWARLQVLPSDQGWWPVVAVELEPAANSRVGGDWASHVGCRRIVIICFYQLLGDRLIGWWIEGEVMEYF